MNSYERILLIFTYAVLCLCGCQGPQTRILPRQNVSPEQPYELTGANTVLEEANPFYLQEALDFLSAAPRVCGSSQETNAAEYIKRMMDEYGYEVTIQRFPVTSERMPLYGTNVVAVKASSESEGDILLVTTSHDSAEGSPGANDNASGAVAFLETARLIAKMATDTEIRFVSFSGSDDGNEGIRHFMKHLPGDERERIVGVIDLGALGYVYDYDTVMDTVDGNPTFLGSLLETAAAEELEQQWAYRMEDQGRYRVFDRYRIPAVRITQSVTAFERGTPQDRSDIINVEKIGAVSRVLSRTLAELMQDDTSSYLKASQEGNYYRDGALIQRTDRSLPFGQTPEAVEAGYGIPGILLESADTETVVYQYPMKWLGVNQIILTELYYRNGLLAGAVLRAGESGIEFAEMKLWLDDLYGEPALREGGEEPVHVWHDPAGNMNFEIVETDGEYRLEVLPGQAGEDLPAIYPLNQELREGMGTTESPERPEAPLRDRVVLELADLILTPDEREKIEDIVVFTDGIGGRQIYWSGSEEQGEEEEQEEEEQEDTEEQQEEPEPLILYLDREDITDREGNYRDYNDSLRQLVRACAYLYEESYGGLFYENFDNTIGDEFDAAFQAFVLTNRPESDQLEADARTLFFYQFEPLVSVRSDIRRQIGLPL